MPIGENTKIDYWFKGFKWYMINLSFGLFPLILMGLVRWLTGGKEGGEQFDHLVYQGGVVLFVSIAIMGSVAGDYLLSGFRSFGKSIFTIYIFPLIVLGFVSLEFVLICLGALQKEVFNLTSLTTVIVVCLSCIYCTFIKASLYLKEDLNDRV